MRLSNLARVGFQSVSAQPGGGHWRGQSSNSGRDWSAAVGLGYDKAPIYAAVNFACRAFSEVEVVHERLGTDGKYSRVLRSPIERLLASPNPWYTWDTLLSGCLVSEMAGFRGVSYIYKHRSTAGKLVGLEYLPHHGVTPYTAPMSGNFIDYYRLNLGSGKYKIEDPANILLQRYGFMNPRRPQESFGPMAALYLEVANIGQANVYSGNMLANVAQGKLLSLGKTPDGTSIVFGDEEEAQLKQTFDGLRNDGVGGIAFVPLGIEINDLQPSPSEMDVDAINNISEEHIASVFLIAPASMYYGTGLENQNNRASAEAAAKATARSFTKPTMEQKAAQLTMDLVPELGEPGDRVRFLTENIEALQEDKTETEKRNELRGNYWTINELRAAAEPPKPPIPGGDITLSMLKAKQTDTANPDEQVPTDSRTNGKPSKTPVGR